MISAFILGAFALGFAAATAFLLPFWHQDRTRDAARVNELLRLLEAKAAPNEVLALYPTQADVDKTWVYTPDGLIGTVIEDD